MKVSVMNRSVTNVVCCEQVCYERGLLWTGLLCSLRCLFSNVVCYERVFYERGLLWTWSVVNGLL